MLRLISVGCLLAVTAALRLDDRLDYEYSGHKGPNNWHKRYRMCGGDRQSPIALPGKPDRHEFLQPIERVDHDGRKQTEAVMTNTGRLVEFTFQHDAPTLRFNLKKTKRRYQLFKAVLHWGSTLSCGAEHSIGGFQFPAEIQYMYWDTKHKSIEEASRRKGGILISSVLLKAAKNDHPLLMPMFDSLYKINETSKPVKCEFHSCPVQDLKNYYFYEGSLTAPPCYEDVFWVVYMEVLPVSEHSLENLWSLLNDKKEKLVDNKRPSQPLNLRKVYQCRDVASKFDWYVSDEHFNERDHYHMDEKDELTDEESHYDYRGTEEDFNSLFDHLDKNQKREGRSFTGFSGLPSFNLDRSLGRDHAFNLDRSLGRGHAFNLDRSLSRDHAFNLDRSLG